MKLKIGIGFDDVKFGMDPDLISGLLGPVEKEYIDDDQALWICWRSLGVGLKFPNEKEYSLDWIEISNPTLTVEGIKPIGMQASEVFGHLDRCLNETKDMQDFGSWSSVTYNDSWLEIHETHGWVTQINLGVRYDGNKKPNYPA